MLRTVGFEVPGFLVLDLVVVDLRTVGFTVENSCVLVLAVEVLALVGFVLGVLGSEGFTVVDVLMLGLLGLNVDGI